MKYLALAFLLAMIAAFCSARCSAADSLPTSEAMTEALTLAQNQWGYTLKDAAIQFRLEPLNACPLEVDHDIATTQLLDYQTTTRFEGDAPPVVSHAYTYVIRINSACDWSKLDLIATVEHEYGHILIGPDYHSKDPHSIMFRAVIGAQSVTRHDEKVVRAVQLARKAAQQ